MSNWTLVQVKSVDPGTSLAFNSPNTAGNLLVAYVYIGTNGGSGSGYTITGFAGAHNTWTEGPKFSGLGAGAGQAWYCLSCAAATESVSATFGGGGGTNIIIAEYKPAITPVFFSTGNFGTAGLVGFTSLYAGDLGVMASVRWDGGATSTPASGWTVEQNAGNGNPFVDNKSLSPGTQSGGVTWGGGQITSLLMVFTNTQPSQAWIQGAVSSTATANNSLAYPSSVTAGDVLTCINWAQGASVACSTMSISDTLGNSWSPVWGSLQSPSGGTINKFIQGWWCVSKSSGANTVTVNTNATSIGGIELAIGEFSGLVSPALDKSTTLASAISANILGFTMATTLQNEIVFVLTDTNATQSSSPVLSTTDRFTLGSVLSTNTEASAYSIVPSTGSYGFAGTWSASSGGNTMITAAFSIGTSISNGVPNSLMMMGCGI